eukprot:COSAG05_NODE_24469_length_251_cov_0.684211_1_plen_20_part_10
MLVHPLSSNGYRFVTLVLLS